MTKNERKSNADRMLLLRGGLYYYNRRVPDIVREKDDRFPVVRISLKTRDLAEARAKRDLYEAADNELWASMILDHEVDRAQAKYITAVKRAQALGFSYKSISELTAGPMEDLIPRLEALMNPKIDTSTISSIMGLEKDPAVTVSKASLIYFNEISPPLLIGKSEDQKKRWINKKEYSYRLFKECCGDKPLSEITRDDAINFYRYFLNRIAPKAGAATLSASSGNRDFGNMRILYSAYYDYLGQPDRINPFAGLSFKEKIKKTRPPYSVEWITTRVMAKSALAGLNDEARRIVWVLIETGARLSEICNLRPNQIRLDHEVPHIRIEPSFDPSSPREIKTNSSVRDIPLIGIAKAALELHPEGFPRYLDRGSTLSASLNKFFKENNLQQSKDHTIYSFRHAFEDRMKEAGIDDELRRILMGHTIDRPRYGSGGSLKWRYDELKKIELPFDLTIL